MFGAQGLGRWAEGFGFGFGFRLKVKVYGLGSGRSAMYEPQHSSNCNDVRDYNCNTMVRSRRT